MLLGDKKVLDNLSMGVLNIKFIAYKIFNASGLMMHHLSIIYTHKPEFVYTRYINCRAKD